MRLTVRPTEGKDDAQGVPNPIPPIEEETRYLLARVLNGTAEFIDQTSGPAAHVMRKATKAAVVTTLAPILGMIDAGKEIKSRM